MQINTEIYEVLKEFSIDKDKGVLCLLGIYFNLDVEKVCDDDTIKAINLTKIVEKVYGNQTLKWNMPLFAGQQTEWDWVKTEYNVLWNRNMSRKDSNPDCIKRMQEWFKKYPAYRKDDVIRATKAYHSNTKDPQYLKSSAKFIFDGAGADKKSILLAWCEKSAGNTGSSDMRGTITR